MLIWDGHDHRLEEEATNVWKQNKCPRASQAPKRREEDVIPGWSSKENVLCLPHSSAEADTAPPTLAVQGFPP